MKALDSELFALLKKRIKLAQKIMKFKAQKNLPARDPKREAEILKQLIKKLGSKTSAPRAKKFIQSLLQLNKSY